ncbi:MAG TPA: class I adenylate-forming enzyme family protein [Candidatus Hydrogenedentes bacterium]|nr:class I adenylate-forming enzyme family protein [Candidatus Hydrogenedentota bacterium]
MTNIVERIRLETREYLASLAIADGGRRITYGDLLMSVDEAGAVLKKLGVQRGKRVALLCDDSIEYIIMSLAVLQLSAVIVPVPFAASVQEIETVLREMKVNFLIFELGPYKAAGAKRLKAARGVERKFWCLERPSAGNPPDEFFRMNPAFIRFSSGTTGASKGVVISHEAIVERTDAADKALHIRHEDAILWVLSMSFHFVVSILLFLRRGATIILAGNSFPASLLTAIHEFPPNFIYAAPLHYHLLTRLDAVPPEALSKVRIAVSTAITLPRKIAEEFHGKFGFQLSQAYGIIEVGLPFINQSQAASKQCSVGKILPDYHIKIRKQDTVGVGEIFLKGPGFFCAYFSPWKSAKEVCRGGWFNTGDIGRLDARGNLFILGRSKNVINFNGMKIFPAEVEAVLNQHPLVQESLVYGVKHPEYGTLPLADIVLRPGGEDRFCVDALRSFCYRHLAKYKVPKEFHCVLTISKTLSGKVKRTITDKQ